MQKRTGTKRHRPLDRIFEFADIARPVVGEQPRHRILGNSAHVPLGIAEFLKERIH